MLVLSWKVPMAWSVAEFRGSVVRWRWWFVPCDVAPRGSLAEAGEQFVEVVAQACNRIGVAFLEAIVKVAGGRSRRTLVGGIHDLVECALDVGLVGLADFVEDVPDLVSPAALHGNAMQGDRQGSQQAGHHRRRPCRGPRR